MPKKASRAKPSRRNTVWTQPLTDAPWYVRAGAFFGVPTVIAGFLLWFFVNLYGSFVVRLEAIETEIRAQGKTADALLQHLRQDESQAWMTLGALQRICLNTSRTDADRLSCVSLNRGPVK